LNIYADTNILIAKYVPNDPFHKECEKISKMNNIKKIGSPITIVELFSTISRIYQKLKVQIDNSDILNKASRNEIITAIVSYILLDWNLTVPFLENENLVLVLKDFRIVMKKEAFLAATLAPFIQLKTLDNMHIAIAKRLKEEYIELDYFVTSDKGILNKRVIIKKYTEIEVVNPAEFIDLL